MMRRYQLAAVATFASLVAWSPAQQAELTIQLVGNAGIMLSDGETSLLVDLPYESGAFGYERYDPSELQPAGTVVSVITHHHRDHFDSGLFSARSGWQVVGPPSVVNTLPDQRVLAGDNVTVGNFAIIVVPTPHTDDHRSYRIRWRGRTLYFVGDTEQGDAVLREHHLDVLFVTPWLQCALAGTGRSVSTGRTVLYHRAPDGSDRRCGSVESLPQGTRFTLSAASEP